MVVDAALADIVERDADRIAVGLQRRAHIGAPDEVEDRGLGKFRRAFDATIEEVHPLAEAAGDDVDQSGIHRLGLVAAPDADQGLADLAGGVVDLAALVGPGGDHIGQHLLEGRAADALGLDQREIGAAAEGLAVGGQEQGQRPAAGHAERLDRGLVDQVDVGAFLAVDLDADEVLVEVVGGCRVLKGLVRHAVAPVARRVAGRVEDRLARGLRFSQRRLAPGTPVHGVVLVHQEVGAGFVGEQVARGKGCHGKFVRDVGAQGARMGGAGRRKAG